MSTEKNTEPNGAKGRQQLDLFGLPAPPMGKSLAEAKSELFEKYDDGATCPCCEQMVKLYRRKLNSNIAAFVVSMVRAWERRGSKGMVNYLDCTFTGRDYNYAKHWGLATDDPATDKEKRRSGFWRPTPRGVLFAQCQLLVPSHLSIYNNRVIAFGDDLVDVKQCLGNRFDYSELMSA